MRVGHSFTSKQLTHDKFREKDAWAEIIWYLDEYYIIAEIDKTQLYKNLIGKRMYAIELNQINREIEW